MQSSGLNSNAISLQEKRNLETIVEMSEDDISVSCPVTPSLTNQTPLHSHFEISRNSDRGSEKSNLEAITPPQIPDIKSQKLCKFSQS